MRRADVVCAVIFVALGLLLIFHIIPHQVTGGTGGHELPPSFMPYVATGIATLAMALLLLRRLLAGRAVDDTAPLDRESFAFIGTAALVLAGAVVAMTFLGYIAGAAVIVAGFMTLARASVRIVLVSTILFPVALWLLFDQALGFPLP
jgi:hypothetical protein